MSPTHPALVSLVLHSFHPFALSASLSVSFSVLFLFCSQPLIHRWYGTLCVATCLLGRCRAIQQQQCKSTPSRFSSARSTSSYWHTSVLSLFLLFSLALHLNHSRSKIAAVDEEATGREWRDFAHCAAIIPVTRDTLRTPGWNPRGGSLPSEKRPGPILFARDPWGGPSICAREKTQHGSRVSSWTKPKNGLIWRVICLPSWLYLLPGSLAGCAYKIKRWLRAQGSPATAHRGLRS